MLWGQTEACETAGGLAAIPGGGPAESLGEPGSNLTGAINGHINIRILTWYGMVWYSIV